MTEALIDFPTIEAAPMPGAAQVPALKPTAALDIEKIDLNALAVAKFGDWRGDVAKVRKTLDGAVHDLTTQAKVDEAKSLRFRLIGQPRADVRKVSKALKSKLAATSKVVGAEEDAAVAAYDDAETLLTPQIEASEGKLAAEKAERERIEAERVAKHQASIANIRAFLSHCQQPGMTAERIQSGIAMLAEQTYTTEHWQEFAVPAANAQCETLEAMRNLHAQAVEREAEAARLEAQRVENERVAREQAEQRAELDRQAEALKAQQQRLAGLQARIAEIRAASTGHEKASAADLREAAVAVAALDVSELQYAEFAALAQAERATTLAVLEKLHADAVKREEAEALARARATLTVGPEPELLLQDECKGLSVSLATKPDAPMHAREAAAAIEPAPVLSDKATADDSASAWVDGISTTLEVSPPMAGTVTADPAPADPQAAFLALVMSAFDCKFPSHPKPSIAWWAAVRKAGEELRDAA